MSSCMWLAGICRKPGNLSSTLEHALHPISALRAPGAGLSHLLDSYGMCISRLWCVYIQIFPVCPVSISTLSFWSSSLLGAGLQGELEHLLPGPECLVATRVPLVFISFSFLPCL